MTGKELRLLTTILETIASMKEKKGSTLKKIVERVAYNTIKSKVTVLVQKALAHAVNRGLVKHHKGKYALRLNTEDSDDFREKIKSFNLYNERLRRSEREKRNSLGWKPNTCLKKSLRGSRKIRRGNSKWGKNRLQVALGENKANDEVNIDQNLPLKKKKENQLKGSSNSDQTNDQKSKNDEDITCGNPDCLCTTIKENDSNLN